MTTPKELAAFLAAPEGVQLEFKEARNRYDFEDLLRYCVALANEGGGSVRLDMQAVGFAPRAGDRAIPVQSPVQICVCQQRIALIPCEMRDGGLLSKWLLAVRQVPRAASRNRKPGGTRGSAHDSCGEFPTRAEEPR